MEAVDFTLMAPLDVFITNNVELHVKTTVAEASLTTHEVWAQPCYAFTSESVVPSNGNRSVVNPYIFS